MTDAEIEDLLEDVRRRVRIVGTYPPVVFKDFCQTENFCSGYYSLYDGLVVISEQSKRSQPELAYTYLHEMCHQIHMKFGVDTLHHHGETFGILFATALIRDGTFSRFSLYNFCQTEKAGEWVCDDDLIERFRTILHFGRKFAATRLSLEHIAERLLPIPPPKKSWWERLFFS